jgi:hypothetical protein
MMPNNDNDVGNWNTPVSAAELTAWIGGTVEDVEALVRDGVLRPNEAGLFGLGSSVKAAIKFWQDAVAMGGTPQGEA